eukprot:TRINITY_DN3426_c0_g1_i1.p1 TRINITY_DN3426_c0_g1~~TRINITY_DN3426_c0_g1_i1.p1  ORF type:complete len:260 (-),score=65.83 TRINITY_DN3426_c0_g1_i1:51-830(-)
MGADGGSIPRREELVKVKPKEEVADQNEVTRIKWSSCSLSKEQLSPPIVADELGSLFNKESVLRNLIEKSMPPMFSHIRTVKDVFPVNLKSNPAYKSLREQTSLNLVDMAKESPFVCPISGVEACGKHRFSVIKSCGCALSDKAMKECPSEICLQCNKPFVKEDVIPLNPPEDELKEMRAKLKAKLEAEKEKKKLSGEGEKKKKKNKRKADDTDATKKVAAPYVAKAPKVGDASVYASLFTSSKKESVPVTFTSTKAFS